MCSFCHILIWTVSELPGGSGRCIRNDTECETKDREDEKKCHPHHAYIHHRYMCTASAYQAIDREDLIKSPKSLIRGKKVERIRLAEVRD